MSTIGDSQAKGLAKRFKREARDGTAEFCYGIALLASQRTGSRSAVYKKAVKLAVIHLGAACFGYLNGKDAAVYFHLDSVSEYHKLTLNMIALFRKGKTLYECRQLGLHVEDHFIQRVIQDGRGCTESSDIAHAMRDALMPVMMYERRNGGIARDYSGWVVSSEGATAIQCGRICTYIPRSKWDPWREKKWGPTLENEDYIIEQQRVAA